MRNTRPLRRLATILLANPQGQFHRYSLSKDAAILSGTLYMMLGRLEKRGWLASEWEDDDVAMGRPRRRYYTLTDAGRQGLEDLDKPPEMPTIHSSAGYNQGCRCQVCTDAATEYMHLLRERKYEQRTLIDERWVATRAKVHGTKSTYNNWGCRCLPCTGANTTGQKNRRTSVPA
jgi:DNA-binding PadR family transcriptional regulator